ncbi:hypothetical protein [Ralstonia insidiosa]|uniref:Uncharacterized protein n=1 Tax=Ralstonia insidiosa TaxID=190721 RepID=A0A848NVA7_9RALS|nr:hypothetical protein [Ralstonia insidiosa]NMV37210.1 hypothetical protein [Ralstonia insidiosa]
MDMQARDYQKEAMRAAKRGDTAKLDEIELAYVQAHVVLFDPDRIYEDNEGLIRGHAVRVVRGAGTDGRTLVQWAKTDGGFVWSELNGELVQMPARYADTAPLFPVM